VELYASIQVQEVLPLLKYSSSKSDTASAREESISIAGTPTSGSKRSLKGTAKKLNSGYNGAEKQESVKGEVAKDTTQKQWMEYWDFCSTFE